MLPYDLSYTHDSKIAQNRVAFFQKSHQYVSQNINTDLKNKDISSVSNVCLIYTFL